MIAFALPFGARKKAAPAPSLKILVADDNVDAVTTLAAVLADEGHEVRGVHNGLAALRADLDFKPHVVILDLQMPDIGGFDLARWLRSRHRKRCPLLVAVSGQFTRPADRELARTSGFDHYLNKPYEIRELLNLLRSYTTG